MKRILFYAASVLFLNLFGVSQLRSQGVPELMYFKFNTSSGNETPNEAPASTRLGGANATLTGNLSVGGVGQFGSGMVGSGASSSSNYLDAGWTGSYTGSWTISMYLDVIALSRYEFYVGRYRSRVFICVTGCVSGTNLLLRGTVITDVEILDLYSGPIVVTFAYDDATNTIKAYKNGVLVATETGWTSPTIQGSDFKIGAYASNNGLNGIMDEFRFYNRALGDGEVADTWDQTLPLSDCSGQPDLGIINGPANECPNFAFSLSASNINAGGYEFVWQESVAGQNNWSTIAGATNSSVSFANGINTAMDYRVIATCTFSNLSDTSDVWEVGINAITDCYCTPSISGGTTYHITNFSTSGGATNINNSSTGNSSGYEDYSNISVSTYAGATIDYSISTHNTTSTYGRAMWIDWNQDGVFDASEKVLSSTSYAAGPFTGDFTVPAGVQPGDYRLRVLVSFTPANPNDPCTNSGSGEYEDYTVNIFALSDCTDADAGTISSTATEACSDEDFTLSASGMTGPGNGLTYQWQESPAGLNTWTDIAGAHSSNVTINGVSDDTDYRLVVECSFGNLADTSNVVTVNASPALDCYCTPSTTSGTTYHITNFSTNGGATDINNSSTGNSTGYEDYTNISVSTYAGATIDYTITTSGTTYTYGRAMWIDWNQDGVFDASEKVLSSSSYASGPFTGDFTVPAGVQPGDYRLRVLVSYTPSNPNDPCTNSGNGEYEDYTVNIFTLSDCADADAGTISSTSTYV